MGRAHSEHSMAKASTTDDQAATGSLEPSASEDEEEAEEEDPMDDNADWIATILQQECTGHDWMRSTSGATS